LTSTGTQSIAVVIEAAVMAASFADEQAGGRLTMARPS